MLLLLIKCLEAVGWVPAPSTDGQVYGWGWGRWRTDSATNLHRKAFDSCKLSVYIWLLGDSRKPSPQTHTGLGKYIMRNAERGMRNFDHV